MRMSSPIFLSGTFPGMCRFNPSFHGPDFRGSIISAIKRSASFSDARNILKSLGRAFSVVLFSQSRNSLRLRTSRLAPHDFPDRGSPVSGLRASKVFPVNGSTTGSSLVGSEPSYKYHVSLTRRSTRDHGDMPFASASFMSASKDRSGSDDGLLLRTVTKQPPSALGTSPCSTFPRRAGQLTLACVSQRHHLALARGRRRTVARPI